MQREQRTFWAAVATLALFAITGCGGATPSAPAQPTRGDVIGVVSDDASHVAVITSAVHADYDNDDPDDPAIKLDGRICKKDTPASPPPSLSSGCRCRSPKCVLWDFSKLKDKEQ